MKILFFRLAFVFGLIGLMFVLAACSSEAQSAPHQSTDPDSNIVYVLVTAAPGVTATPFQPSAPIPTPIGASPTPIGASGPVPVTELPTATNPPIETIAPSPTDIGAEPPKPLETSEVVPATQQPSFPAADEGILRPRYTLSALLDYYNHTVQVQEDVYFPNRYDTSLADLAFAVNANLWSGVFSLQKISLNGVEISNFNLGGQWLTIPLDTPLQPGQAVQVHLEYGLTLPASSARFENFGYTSRQTNLIDWYPFIPPNRNGQWLLPDPYMYGENLVYPVADFAVNLAFADPASPPVIAASSPGLYQDGAYAFQLQNARNFTISASTDFLVDTADANGITIYSYYFPSSAKAAARVLEMTRLAVLTYSEVFGAYPHTSLSVCETDLNDGLETDGLYFLASNFYQAYDGTVTNNLSTIAVHETAHLWWYGAVANDQASEPWLDETMSTYSEHIFYEKNYPDLINWWWNFRINSVGASGWVDSRVYDTSSFRAYVSSVYFNGAKFLQALRDRVGDPAFFDFIRDYYQRYSGKIARADDFFTILATHSTQDISDLLKTYFYYR